MRIFILALDGLEYTLVEKWQLEHLQQADYGVYPTIKSQKYKQAYTPKMWSTIITGKTLEQHGVNEWWTYGKLDKLRNVLPLGEKGKYMLMKLLGFLGVKPRLKVVDCPTMFDAVKPSVALDIPGYNERIEPRIKLNDALMKHGLKAYENTAWKIYAERVNHTFVALTKPWRLFMTYFSIADTLGHAFISKHINKLKQVYYKLNFLAWKLKTLTEDGSTLFMILSDHGMKPAADGTGVHTDYGYLSMNMQGLLPKQGTVWQILPTQFYAFITSLLKVGGKP